MRPVLSRTEKVT